MFSSKQLLDIRLELSVNSTRVNLKTDITDLETDTLSRHNWNYCALCIEIVLFS